MPAAGSQRTDISSLAESVRGHEGSGGQAPQGAGDREPPAKEGGGRSDPGQADSGGSAEGKIASPARRREAAKQAQTACEVSERRACEVIEQPRSTQRYCPRVVEDEAVLVK